MSEAEKNFFKKLDEYSKDINANKNISSETIYRAINNLSCFLSCKVMIEDKRHTFSELKIS